MPAIVCMLRAVNLPGHNKIKMEALRSLCESFKFECVQTYVQSGNVVFLTKEKNLHGLSGRIGRAIRSKVGFQPDVILRTAAEMRRVVAKNPFVGRHGIEPAKLLVAFLAGDPGKIAREGLSKLDMHGEELHAGGSELYIYFQNGMGRSKLPWPAINKALGIPSTSRNWNTVLKLLKMAESLEKPARV
jgi:uncharacterized protein (DUF1697 family)